MGAVAIGKPAYLELNSPAVDGKTGNIDAIISIGF